jgi:hypothetical protein
MGAKPKPRVMDSSRLRSTTRAGDSTRVVLRSWSAAARASGRYLAPAAFQSTPLSEASW